MSAERIKAGNNKKKRDPDFITAEIAMKRASEKAREKAKRVGSGVVVLKEGKIVEEEHDLAV